MDELIELLKQIQELAGVGIEALENVAGGGGEGGPAAPPPEDKPKGDAPPPPPEG